MFQLHQRRLLIVFITLLLTAGEARGQNEGTTTNQLWADYDPTWRLSERWTLDVDTAIRIINSDQFLWQIRLQPTLEFSPWKWMDLTGGVWLIYTRQAETFDRFEMRPVGGMRLKVDIWRGVGLNNYLRAEYRVQRNLDTGETTAAGRLRNRIQAMIPINHQSLSEDNTWSAIVDTEWFWQRDQNVNDGFNSRRRNRVGIGWRKNSTWTFRLFYILQRTRETAAGPFSTVDHVISFSVIQHLK
ncbi:MAG TPA: DUF2490 domain-containing protein [Blastocatellia bacterium]|nr:DUF2490 domain-containing protein [Blastocatellia bacterium]